MNEKRRKLNNDEYSKRHEKKANGFKLSNQTKLVDVDRFYERKKIEVAKYYHELESKWDV